MCPAAGWDCMGETGWLVLSSTQIHSSLWLDKDGQLICGGISPESSFIGISPTVRAGKANRYVQTEVTTAWSNAWDECLSVAQYMILEI